MVPRDNKNNAYAKFGGANKEYYGIFRNGLLVNRAYYYWGLRMGMARPLRAHSILQGGVQSR